jgi:hypothetical protein
LRQALTCFLIQDYPGPKRLLILNDAPVPISLPGAELRTPKMSQPLKGETWADSPDWPVSVWNRPVRCHLGRKREFLLERSATDLVAHWDDDDIQLPSRLSMMAAQLTTDICAVMLRGLWELHGTPGGFSLGHTKTISDGSVVFRRGDMAGVAKYSRGIRGCCLEMRIAWEKAGKLAFLRLPVAPLIVRREDGIPHIHKEGSGEYYARTVDFGGEAAAKPAMRDCVPAVLTPAPISLELLSFLRLVAPALLPEERERNLCEIARAHVLAANVVGDYTRSGGI